MTPDEAIRRFKRRMPDVTIMTRMVAMYEDYERTASELEAIRNISEYQLGGSSMKMIPETAFLEIINYCTGGLERATALRMFSEKAVDAEPVKRREWRFVGCDGWNDCYECSGCGKMALSDSAYCPECGAKMKEKD